MEEVGKEDPVREMGEARHGISHCIFFNQHSEQGLMELVSPGHEGNLPEQESDHGSGYDDAAFFPTFCRGIVYVCADMCDRYHAWRQQLELGQQCAQLQVFGFRVTLRVFK